MLKKIITILFILIITANVNADDNKILSIDVTGTQRVDVETVKSYSRIEIGETYNEELGNNALKNLFNTNLFSNIEIFFENNILIIKVIENPTINLIKFTGNSLFKK